MNLVIERRRERGRRNRENKLYLYAFRHNLIPMLCKKGMAALRAKGTDGGEETVF